MDRHRARRRASAWCLLAGLVAAGCADTEAEVEDSTVSVTVPDDWHRSDPEVTADVLESLRWAPEGDSISTLQVIVGCGSGTSAEELLQAAATGERALPVVGTAEQPTSVDVEGLDDARRVTFALGPSQDDVRAWMAGLYGTGDGVLVLVELMRSHARFDRGLADEVLGSVSVDTATAAERCESRTE